MDGQRAGGMRRDTAKVEKDVERVEKDEGTKRIVMYGWTDEREEIENR